MTQVEQSPSGQADDQAFDSPHPLGRHGRMVSWIAGIAGLILIVLGAIWLSHSATDSSGGGGGGGRGGGRGGGGGGGRRGGGGFGGGGGASQPTTVGTVKTTL